LSTPVENSEATWKKATKCNKRVLGYEHMMRIGNPPSSGHCSHPRIKATK
jgi:hypothetical protein